MLRVLGWFGLYVGAPSVATLLSSQYLSYVDHFVMLFLVSMIALVIAILPRLQDDAPQSAPARPVSRD